MSIAFSHSMRSLQTDRGYLALAWLIVAASLIVAWVMWLFLARMTIYTTGQLTTITRDGAVLATFPGKEAARLQIGQRALLHPTGDLAKTVGAIPAQVIDVTPQAGTDDISIELYPLSEQIFLEAGNLANPVDVEVEQVSPAVLVARLSGQWIDTAPVVLSPQVSQ